MTSPQTGTDTSDRRHVLGDVEPYSCAFEHCEHHAIFFREKKSWITHMQQNHSMQWRCGIKHAEPLYFQRPEEYDNHMLEVHAGSFTPAQLPFLREKDHVPARVMFRQCPLTGFYPSPEKIQTELAKQYAIGNDRELQDRAASDLITAHLAHEMESLAVMSLPWTDVDDDEAQSQPSEPHIDRKTSTKTEDSQLSIGRESCSWDTTDITEWPDDDTDQVQTDLDVAHLNLGETYEAEWGFIPLQVYYGTERDPVLQPFLRQVYLATLSATTQTPAAQRRPNLPLFLLPRDQERNFHGRDYALNAIQEELCHHGSPVNIKSETKPCRFPLCFAIYGPGGMGKTQVAARFASLHREHFDAVIWVNAENADKMFQSFNDIAIRLGLVDEHSMDAKDQVFTRDVVKSWLLNPSKGNGDSNESGDRASWLLVFDGVEEGNMLNDFWPYDVSSRFCLRFGLTDTVLSLFCVIWIFS